MAQYPPPPEYATVVNCDEFWLLVVLKTTCIIADPQTVIFQLVFDQILLTSATALP